MNFSNTRIPRRAILSAASILAGGGRLLAQGRRNPSGPVLLYVATYSSPEGPEGSHGRGEGIYLFQMDPASGALQPRETFKDASNPSCVALRPGGRTSIRRTSRASLKVGIPVR